MCWPRWAGARPRRARWSASASAATTTEDDVDAFIAAWRDDGRETRARRERGMIYLDYQATTPLAPEALEAMLPWLRDGHRQSAFGAPRRPGREGGGRGRARPGRGAAAAGRARDPSPAARPRRSTGRSRARTGPIVTLATEHAAVLDTVAAQAAAGREVTVLPVGADGLVDLDAAARRSAPARDWSRRCWSTTRSA